MSTASTLAGRLGRHSFVYAVGVGSLVLLGLANVAVFTRLMPPSEFGTLFVLLALSTGLSILYGLSTIQGTVGLVFGKGTEDGESLDDPGGVGAVEPDDDPDADWTEQDQTFRHKREALGTGLILTAAVAAIGTAVMWVQADEVSRLLFDTPREIEAIRLAALIGGVTAVWRVLLTVLRFERRPRAFVSFNVARPALAIAVGAPLVARGHGAAGVLEGLLIATAVATAVALVFMRKAYRLRFEPRFVPTIMALGIVFVPVVLSLYVINHAGALILSPAVSSSEIGLYGVASMFGMSIASFAGVFFMAWLPMKRTSLFVAVHHERGHGWLHSTMTTYFVLAVCTLLVAVTVASTLLVRIAGPEYSEADVLIPPIGVAATAYAVFLLAYRISAFPRKRLALGLVSILAAGTFVGAALLLVDRWGVYAIPAAAFWSLAWAAAAMLTLNQRGPRAIPFEYGRLTRIALIAIACVGANNLVMRSTVPLQPLLDAGTLLIYVALLLASRAVSRADIASLLRVARDTVVERRRHRSELAARLATLSPEDLKVLELAAGPGRRGAVEGLSPSAIVAALRAVVPTGEPTQRDDSIGRYLVSDLSRAERDALARALWARGVSPAELDRLEHAVEDLRSLPAAAWPLPSPSTANAGRQAS